MSRSEGPRRAALAALLLALGACAPLQWVDKKTGSPAGAEAAFRECQAQAWLEARDYAWRFGWPYIYYPPYAGHIGRYRAHPFGRFAEIDAYHELTDFCMRAKGFALVEVPEAPAPK